MGGRRGGADPLDTEGLAELLGAVGAGVRASELLAAEATEHRATIRQLKGELRSCHGELEQAGQELRAARREIERLNARLLLGQAG